MEQKNFFYFVLSNDDTNRMMFRDIRTMENAAAVSDVFRIANPILAVLNKLHFSIKINQRIPIPGKSVWKSCFEFEQLCTDADTTYWMIVTNWSAARIGKDYLKELSRRKNVRRVLLYLDSVDAVSVQDRYYTEQFSGVDFSLIYSFDRQDCERFGWEYAYSFYSMVPLEPVEEPENDLYFIGSDKGRLKQIRRLYDRLQAAGVKCDFYIRSDTEPVGMEAPGLHIFRHRVPYQQVLEGIRNTRCILEIVQDGQSGMTLRPYEAMFYNKKLITNNSRLLEMPFYRSDYMRVFSAEEDFPVEFAAEKTEVDYHYAGEYSPVHWLEQMPQDYEEKKRREASGKHGQN